MANIDDLDYDSLSDTSVDEALELIRQIRLNRRVPVKTKKATKRKEKQLPSVDSSTAAELLRILGGE